jgi:hypothetical protein
MLSRQICGIRTDVSALLVASQYFASKSETTHTRAKSPIKVQWALFLVQLKNVLKGESPSKIRDRQSPNFVQRDSYTLLLMAKILDILLRYLISNVIRLPNCERDNRQCRICCRAGCELTAV